MNSEPAVVPFGAISARFWSPLAMRTFTPPCSEPPRRAVPKACSPPPTPSEKLLSMVIAGWLTATAT